MDPQKTWTDMLDALKQNDHEEAKELAGVLLEWLGKEGFPPIVVGDGSLGADWHRTIAAFICRSVVSRTKLACACGLLGRRTWKHRFFVGAT